VTRFSEQYLADADAGRSPAMDRLIRWLPAHLPSGTSTAIVHGDYKIDNVVFHPSEPRVIAVLDWELSTLGNPVADFAFLAMMYRMPQGLASSVLERGSPVEGLPDEAAFVADYCRRTGRVSIPDLGYYIAFNMFRLAAIIHGIRGRMLRGIASSASAHLHAAKFEAMAEAAWDQVELYEAHTGR